MPLKNDLCLRETILHVGVFMEGGGVMAKTKEHEKERQQLRDLPHDDTHCSVRRGLTACGMGLPARNKLR